MIWCMVLVSLVDYEWCAVHEHEKGEREADGGGAGGQDVAFEGGGRESDGGGESFVYPRFESKLGRRRRFRVLSQSQLLLLHQNDAVDLVFWSQPFILFIFFFSFVCEWLYLESEFAILLISSWGMWIL